MNEYHCLSKNKFSSGDYTIVPIRDVDKMNILKWRNEQIFHLRQPKPLTEEDQKKYFTNVIAKLFEQKQPDQLLFSFLKNEECIGYGGLVHINWIDKHAEISFIMETKRERDDFELLWNIFLPLIEKVAFNEINLHKISTYAYDLRPHLYPIIEKNGFLRDGILRDHILIEKEYKDVLIHSKLNIYD